MIERQTVAAVARMGSVGIRDPEGLLYLAPLCAHVGDSGATGTATAISLTGPVTLPRSARLSLPVLETSAQS